MSSTAHYCITLYFRGEENFAGGKFREITIAVKIIFAGGKFRAKSKFANIAKISSTRKIGVIQYLSFKNGLIFWVVWGCPMIIQRQGHASGSRLKWSMKKPMLSKIVHCHSLKKAGMLICAIHHQIVKYDL